MGIFGKRYDCFVSYKSKNVDIARQIADLLLASGRRVWFAEYQVLLTERHRFQQAIDKGARDCDYGIALTNDDYAKSPYCDDEMTQLLLFCGPKKVLEIMTPSELLTRQNHPELDGSPAHVFTGNVDDALGFIRQTTGWKIVPRVEASSPGRQKLFEGRCLDDPYTVDVTGWELIDESFHGGGPCYARKIEKFDVFWNLQFGEELDPRVSEARLGMKQDDEVALYDEICAYAHHYFGDLKPGSRVVGAHLLYYRGQGQFAVTYTDGRFWKRRLSLMILQPGTRRAAEFLFTFQFPGSFNQYCRCAQLMDALVMTLRWGKGL